MVISINRILFVIIISQIIQFCSRKAPLPVVAPKITCHNFEGLIFSYASPYLHPNQRLVNFDQINAGSDFVIVSLLLWNCQSQSKDCQKPPYSKTNSPAISRRAGKQTDFKEIWL